MSAGARAIALAALSMVTAGGCSPLTAEEAQATLEEAQLVAEAEALVAGTVELGTRFDPGVSVEAAAEALRAAIETALPCAAITVDGALVSIEYGALAGECHYEGQRYAGAHAITIVESDASAVVVEHAWDGFHDDAVAIDGTATVRFSPGDPARHVTSALTATRLADDRAASGTGDRTLRFFDARFEADGTRTWTGTSGAWTLTMTGVRMRFADPLPEAGRYALDAPFGKHVRLTFRRADASTLAAVAESGSRTYDFEVPTLPGG